MTHMLVTTTLPYLTNLPKDVVVNTFHVDGDTAAADIIAGVVSEFFALDAGTNPVAYYLSPEISRVTNACTAEVYDMSQPEPRVPIATVPFTLGAAGNTNAMPSEVALVTSFYAAPQSGSPQARRRGRLYVGPFNTIASTTGGTNPSRPSSTLIADLVANTEELVQNLIANDSPLGVFSRVDNALRDVVGGWVDNAWDTQRRRGGSPTARTAWSLSV